MSHQTNANNYQSNNFNQPETCIEEIQFLSDYDDVEPFTKTVKLEENESDEIIEDIQYLEDDKPPIGQNVPPIKKRKPWMLTTGIIMNCTPTSLRLISLTWFVLPHETSTTTTVAHQYHHIYVLS